MEIIPLNKHILIEPILNLEQSSEINDLGISIPQEYLKRKETQEKYSIYRVISISSDSKYGLILEKTFHREQKIVVDNSAILEIELKDKKYFMVSENYVVGKIIEEE